MDNSKSKTKIEESNKKRLESLKEKLNEYKNKKTLVRSSLNDLDKASQKPKKIVFNDSDSDGLKSDTEDKLKITQKLEIKPKKDENQAKKKFSLIDSDSESENERTKKENQETIKMFESKIELDEKKANKLIYLKSKYSNEDSRFKIDERFMEDEEEEEDKDLKKDSKSIKKQIKSENLNSLKILEEITGKQIIKPKSLEDKESASKKLKNSKNIPGGEINKTKMIRYDPTKDSHKMFEIKKDQIEEEESNSSDEEINYKDDDEESENEEDEEKEEVENVKKKKKVEETNKEEEEKPKEIAEETGTYFRIEPNIKDLFSSSDVFKFQFTNENDDQQSEDENEINLKEKPKSSFLLKDFQFDSFNKSNYSSSETESDENEENEEEDEQEVEKQKHQTSTQNGKIGSNKFNEIKSFLPQFDQDQQIKDALVYFTRPKDLDLSVLRKEWLTKREVLVKECKKKHKKMQRIKRSKDNEKLLPWKRSNRPNSSNNHKKSLIKNKKN